MPTIDRVLAIDEATSAERCVVCGAMGKGAIDLEAPAAGAVLDAHAAKWIGRTLRACASCEAAQDAAKTYGRGAVLAAIFAMPLVALGASLLVRRPDALAAIPGAFVGFVIASIVARLVARARARRVPLLLLEADEESLLVQVNVAKAPSADEPAPAAYREPATTRAPGDRGTLGGAGAPRAPRASFALAWVGSMFVTIAVCGLAGAGALSPRRFVVIDSPSEAVRVTIDDGAPTEIAAGGRANVRVESGKHFYRVEWIATHEAENGSFDVGVMKDTLVTTDPSQCYLVWVEQRGQAVMHGDKRVRWTALENARASQRCE